MSDINLENIEALTKLSLTPEEESVIPEQMESILAYVDLLKEVEVEDDYDYAQVLTGDDMRSDVAVVCEDMDVLFENMPGRDGVLLEVPEVFES